MNTFVKVAAFPPTRKLKHVFNEGISTELAQLAWATKVLKPVELPLVKTRVPETNEVVLWKQTFSTSWATSIVLQVPAQPEAEQRKSDGSLGPGSRAGEATVLDTGLKPATAVSTTGVALPEETRGWLKGTATASTEPREAIAVAATVWATAKTGKMKAATLKNMMATGCGMTTGENEEE